MKPAVAVIMLLPECNMSCSFCVTEDSMGTFSFEQAEALLQRLETERFSSAVFGGGEPLAWRHDVWRIAHAAKRRRLSVQLGTNGILLPRGFETFDSIDRFVLPVDGSTAEVHNAVRFYRAGHFDLIMDRLERLRTVGKSTTISTVVTKANLNDIPNIARFLIRLDEPHRFLHAWHLYQFIPEGRGGTIHRQQLSIDGQAYDEACNHVRNLHTAFRIFKRPDMLHSHSVEFFWMQDDRLHRQLGSRLLIESI